MTESYAELLAYVKDRGRVCPQPALWQQLWEMLPERRRAGNGWQPAVPLILAAWWDSSAAEKRIRLHEHLEWAKRYECIEPVGKFLRGLSERDWLHDNE